MAVLFLGPFVLEEAVAILKLCLTEGYDWDDLEVMALRDGDRIEPWETVMHISGPYAAFAHGNPILDLISTGLGYLGGKTFEDNMLLGLGAAFTAVFVITLDTDTELPRGAARRLVATLAHPLNRAEVEAGTGRVTAGYTILQPRIDVTPAGAAASAFAHLFGGDPGLDLYGRASSDVYQDLFGEGIYVGKGIYDPVALEASLHARAPENAVLSHDLFEGIHGRAALVTDIVLFETYPADYRSYWRRLHRWARGDWQLLPWLGRRVPLAGGGRAPNRLSLISRWKIFAITSGDSCSLSTPARL